MPKSKHRKKHKQKKQAYRRQLDEQKRQVKKIQQAYQEKLTQFYELSRRESVVEAAITQHPNLVIDNEEGIKLNEDLIEVKNNLIYLKDEETPLMEKFDSLVDLSVYNIESMNQYLESLNAKRNKNNETTPEEKEEDGIQEAEIVEEENKQ